MTGPIVVVDTSGLVAAIDRDARLLVSPFVLAESDYVISVRLGRPDRAVRLLEDVARGAYRLEPFSAGDLERAVEVMRQYEDLSVGLADASNVVLAERYGALDLLSLDERHFRVLRGPGGEPFRLLPTDR